jgi:hypothetical protein
MIPLLHGFASHTNFRGGLRMTKIRSFLTGAAAAQGDCSGLLFIERSGTADERTVPKIKSQEPVRIPRNADPDALPDFAGFLVAACKP